MRSSGYWYRVARGEFIAIQNHAGDALEDPATFHLSRCDVAHALKSGQSWTTRRPAVIEAVIARGYVRTRLTANGVLIVQASLPAQMDAVLLVVAGMVERHHLRARTRCVVSDADGSVVFTGRVGDAVRCLRDRRDAPST